MSWAAVTTYTDGTSIEPEKIVSYTAYWTVNASLSGLNTISSPTTALFVTFDPTSQNMTRGSTVYFTAKAVLNTGEESTLAPAYPWIVPQSKQPSPPTMESVTQN